MNVHKDSGLSDLEDLELQELCGSCSPPAGSSQMAR